MVTILQPAIKGGLDHDHVFIACTHNLTGFDVAIYAAFPQTEIQNCITWQLRNSCKYVFCKDLKTLMADLKSAFSTNDGLLKMLYC